MGRYVFKLPDVGEGTAEAEIVAWHVAVGDMIKEDARLAEIMTDKATVELTSPVSGRILELKGELGQMAVVGAPLVIFEIDGAGAEPGQEAVTPVETAAPSAPPGPPPAVQILASPALRRRAEELGIKLALVVGSGPGGRISQQDLDAYRSGGRVSAPIGLVQRHGGTDIKVIGLRRKIAEKMSDANRRITHFSYVEEIDLTALEDVRRQLNEKYAGRREKLTLLPFLMRAMVTALAEFPQINAHYDDEAGIIHRFNPVHIGIATQTEGGLMVPVVRHAEACDLWQLAQEVARVAKAARDGSAARDLLSGSTITLSSLGALGGIVATPVINSPEVAIIGVNKLVERPMVQRGQVVIRKMMNLSSSFDHRVVDGFDAASFIQAMRRLLENPEAEQSFFCDGA